MNDALLIREHADLSACNTLGVTARARYLVTIHSAADMRRVLDDPLLGRQRKWVLGKGSNVVLAGELDGVVLHVAASGLSVLEQDDDHVLIEAGAGEDWHAFVQWTLAQGIGGLENLALIPGSVGAAPVQNVGAYGLEQSEWLHSLDLVDLVTGRSVTLGRESCRFGYRDSIFKRELAGKSLILRVRYRLPRRWQPRYGYADLSKWFAREQRAPRDAMDVFDAVCAIRRQKLPDPAVLGNAGSFFQNPVVNKTILDEILLEYPQLVSYPLTDGTYKLAAGWMIEACGWRGKRLGPVGMFERHALVLVNHGGASGEDVLQLAVQIQQDVRARFGLTLELEPVVMR